MSPGVDIQETSTAAMWEALTAHERAVLGFIGQSEVSGADDVFFAVETESEPVRAALASLLLRSLIVSRKIPMGPIVYKLSETGLGLYLFGVPEKPEDAKETQRAIRYLNRKRR